MHIFFHRFKTFSLAWLSLFSALVTETIAFPLPSDAVDFCPLFAQLCPKLGNGYLLVVAIVSSGCARALARDRRCSRSLRRAARRCVTSTLATALDLRYIRCAALASLASSLCIVLASALNTLAVCTRLLPSDRGFTHAVSRIRVAAFVNWVTHESSDIVVVS